MDKISDIGLVVSLTTVLVFPKSLGILLISKIDLADTPVIIEIEGIIDVVIFNPYTVKLCPAVNPCPANCLPTISICEVVSDICFVIVVGGVVDGFPISFKNCPEDLRPLVPLKEL